MTIVHKSIVIIGAGTAGIQVARDVLTAGTPLNDIIILDRTKPDTQNIPEGLHIEYQWYVLKLLTIGNQIEGVIAIDKTTGEIISIKTNNVVLATGSYAAIFRKSTQPSPTGYCGGIQLALDAGARVENLGAFEQKLNPDNGDAENILTDNLVETYGRIEVGLSNGMTSVAGLYAVSRTQSCVRIIHTIPHPSLSDSDFDILCTKELSRLRAIPDLGQIRALQNQLSRVMWKTSVDADSRNLLQEGLHLLEVFADGVERIAIEPYSDKVNIYQLCETRELIGSIITAVIVIKSRMNQSEKQLSVYHKNGPRMLDVVEAREE